MVIKKRPAGGPGDEAWMPVDVAPDGEKAGWPRKAGRPRKGDQVEEFISGAPDGGKAGGRFKKGYKVQITLTIDEALLDRVDELAGRLGVSRAALVSMSLGQTIESGLRLANDASPAGKAGLAD